MEGFNIRSIFNYFVLCTYKIIGSLSVTFFLLTLLFTQGIALSLFYLADYFYKNKAKSALFSLFFIMAYQTSFLGSINLIDSILTPNIISWCFALISLNLILRNKTVSGFAILGLAAIFHTITGLMCFSIYYFIHIFINIRKPIFTKSNLIYLIKPISFIIIGAPALIQGLLISSRFTDQSLITHIVARFRHPWHCLPSSWDFSLFVATILLVVLGLLFLRDNNFKQKSVFYVSYIICILYAITGYIFVEIIPISSFALFHMFRAVAFMFMVSYIIIFNEAYELWASAKSIPLKLFALLFIFSFATFVLRYLFILLALIFIFIKLKENNYIKINRGYFLFAGIAIAIILGGLLYFTFPTLLRYLTSQEKISLIKSLLVPAFIIFFIYLLCSALIIYPKNKKIIFLLIAILVIISFVDLKISPLNARSDFEPEMKEICLFAQENTPINSIFLTPPDEEQWRLCLNRAIVVDFKTIPLDDRYMVEWYIRIINVTNNHFTLDDRTYGENQHLNEYYTTLNETQLQILKEKFHFSYAIFNKDKELEFPLITKNREYIVYNLTG
ncbi:MAG: DUF6798 domain-containing protein [Candidatus Nanoarchaeia archaeon]|jgi:hypothetical protein